MLGLLRKSCPMCGIEVDKNNSIKRFGKYFCSEEHAKRYEEMKAEMDASKDDHSGGCCC